MTAGSPHLYRQNGRAQGTSDDVLDAALAQAHAVESRGLAPILTLNHLAVRAGVSYHYLRDIASRAYDPYDDLVLLRRNSRKMRPISIPQPPLMHVQRWILHRVLGRIPLHTSSYAYRTGSSIRACATQHAGARWLVKLDIRSFFETIDERKVFRVFQDAGYVDLVAFELARLCTRSARYAKHIDVRKFIGDAKPRVIQPYSQEVLGFLPQGAPTSGALANLVVHDLDITFSALAQQQRMVYTRYADDLTFSSIEDFNLRHATQLIRDVDTALRSAGFSLHKKKTHVVPPGSRKVVLGLLVDRDHVRLNRAMRSRIAEHVRGVEKFGLAPHVAHRRFSSIDGLVHHVDGLLAFATDIEPGWAAEMKARWQVTLEENHWR